MKRIQCDLCEFYGDEEKMQKCDMGHNDGIVYMVHLRCFMTYKVVAKATHNEEIYKKS